VNRYRIAAKFHELHKNPQMVIDYLWKAYCVDIICYGENSPHAVASMDYINDVEERIRGVLVG